MFFIIFSTIYFLRNKTKSLRDFLGMSTCLNLSPSDNEVKRKAFDEYSMNRTMPFHIRLLQYKKKHFVFLNLLTTMYLLSNKSKFGRDRPAY